MAQKASMPISNFKSLCEFDGEKYVSKSGAAYIEALKALFPPKNPDGKRNKNDTPFTREDILKQPKLGDFDFPGVKDFVYVCNLEVDPLVMSNDERSNEKIYAIDFQGEAEKNLFEKRLGVVYLLTCVVNGNEHIVKIGCSRTTFKDRLGSYNCGTVNNWRTASTTNIKMLQSFVATRERFKLYLFDSGEPEVFDWHGVKSVPFASQIIYAVEDILVKKFLETFGHKPLVNVQTSATKV